MDLVGGRVAEVLAGMMGGAFVEVGDAFWRGVKAAGRPEMGTQRRGGGGGAEGGLGDWELFGWGALRVFAGLLRNRHSARLWGINVER